METYRLLDARPYEYGGWLVQIQFGEGEKWITLFSGLRRERAAADKLGHFQLARFQRFYRDADYRAAVLRHYAA